MKKYSQLTEGQRYQIEVLKQAGKIQKEIATLVGVSAGTISRELKRNTGQRGYRPRQAQIKTFNRRKEATKPHKMTAEVISLIETKIQLDWSPEQVSGWLKLKQYTPISHERIYQLFGLINFRVASYISILGKAIKNEKSNRDQRISEDRLEIESVLMNVLKLLSKKPV